MKTKWRILVAATLMMVGWAAGSMAECIDRMPGSDPCYCASYTGPVYFTVLTADRPCSVVTYWGPWVGRGTANWNNYGGGQRFVVRMNKTKPDNVGLRLCAGQDAATLINGPYRYNPASTWPILDLTWSSR